MDILRSAFLTVYIFVCRLMGVRSACATSHLKWPLLPTTCTLEVLSSTSSIIDPPCPLSFTEGYPVSGQINNSVQITAGSFFDVDVTNITVNSNDDYGISIYIYPQTDSGPLFDYQSTDGSFELKVWLDSGYIRASRLVTNNPYTYLVNEQLNPVIVNTWQKVGVSVDTGAKKLITHVSNNLQINKDSVSTKDQASNTNNDIDRLIVTPGKIRVGGMFNNSVPRTFAGFVTCIGLVKDDKNLDCLTDCASDTSWSVNPTYGNFAKLQYATFSGVLNNVIPTVLPIHQSMTKSPIMCAVKCLRDFQTCRSFTFASQSNNCSLFRETYTLPSDFSNHPGHIYYKLLSYI